MKLGSLEKLPDQNLSEKEKHQLDDLRVIIESERVGRPEPDDFSDIYSRQKIEEDKKELTDIKARIANDERGLSVEERRHNFLQQNRAEALERLVEEAELTNWLGPNAMVSRTSEFDDVKNGTDAIVEFTPEPEDLDKGVKRMAMAVDAYSGTSWRGLEKKLKKNADRMSGSMDLVCVEYFESQVADEDGAYYRGPLEDVVPVVIGISGENADELFKDFAKLIRIRSKGRNINDMEKEIRTRIENKIIMHPVQLLFLRQIRMQLEKYYSMTMTGNARINENTLAQIEDMLDIIGGIITEKEAQLNDIGNIKRDSISDKMEEILQRL